MGRIWESINASNQHMLTHVPNGQIASSPLCHCSGSDILQCPHKNAVEIQELANKSGWKMWKSPQKVKNWHLSCFAVLKEGCHEILQPPYWPWTSSHLSYVWVYSKIFMWNLSTTGSGQNRLGIKPKAEPGGSKLDLIQQLIQAKKIILNHCWIRSQTVAESC